MGQITLKGSYLWTKFQRPPPPSKKNINQKKRTQTKKILHQPDRLAEVRTELHWHRPMLMILRILISKNMRNAVHGKRPFIRTNPTITEPLVEVSSAKRCLVALILVAGL